MRLTAVALVVCGPLGALVAAPSAEAQDPARIPWIGVLEADRTLAGDALHDGLRQLGYVEGKNISIERRWVDGRAERFPEFAAEMVRLKVDVIVATNNPAVAAAQAATTTIPIVMVLPTDPVRLGFVTSLARPAGNITGLTIQTPELAGKRLELLKETVPRLTRVAVLWHPTEPGRRLLVEEIEAAAPKLRLQIQTLEARDARAVRSAFAAMTRERAGAVFIYASSMFAAQRTAIAELAARNRLPTMCATPEWMDAGFVMAYGPSLSTHYRRTAYFVDRILKGARPADLPVEQPTKFDLVINTKTAKGVGLTIPPSLLLRADRIID